MGKIIFFIILILLIGISFYINSQSNEFRISRKALISAPAEEIFNQINDFHHWNSWSPWAKLDPNQKTEFSGADRGQGAMMYWNGNAQVGEGRNTIIESRLATLITIQLDFLKPFKATSTAKFTFEPQANQTLVTWSMLGEKNFIQKAMHLVMDCDKMLGGQFDEGLANLKRIVE